MLRDRIEWRWIDAFRNVFTRCSVSATESCVILSETQSRALNPHLAELALESLGALPAHVTLPTPAQTSPVPVRSTGACRALRQHPAVLGALDAADFIVDCTVEGLMHAPELPRILEAGARVLTVCNEHPDTLERLLPDDSIKARTQQAARRLRGAGTLHVSSAAGTDLSVSMRDAATVGIWGYTDKPGTLAHWPGGLVVSFPREHSVNGTLVLDRGDLNLTFKRYLEAPVSLRIEDDHVVEIAGDSTDAELHRRYFAAWGDRNAYAVSHVGWGLNPAARYEAMTLYDKGDTNGTELRAFAGNFLFSTGANEFAERYTEGHFDIPVRGCTITLDGETVVRDGTLVDAA
ncbi:MAG: peptidase M29 [Pseudomonadota bacterium]